MTAMKRSVKRLEEYEKIEFNDKKVLAAAKRLKASRKVPTSIALEKETVLSLKRVASERGVPYQVLMRMFVLDGLRKMKRTAS